MKNTLFAIFFVFLLIFSSCKSSTEPEEGVRIGAVCKDGTRSNATGSGACSGHGGVSYWIYK